MSKTPPRAVVLLRLGPARDLTRTVRDGLMVEPLNPLLRYDIV